MKNKHIAVLDDNKDILEMVKTILELEDYEVSTCNLLEELELLMITDKPNVIICDMLMSGQDGRNVCKTFKANPTMADVPFILFTAHPNAEKSCMAANADFFLEKPFDITKFFDSVSQAIELEQKLQTQAA